MQTKLSNQPAPSTDNNSRCCSELAALFDPTLFKALSDPNRVAILSSLSIGAGEQTVSQVAEQFELNFSVISRHLKILKDAGVLIAKKDGKEVRYRVNCALLATALRKMATALEHCCGAEECAGDTQPVNSQSKGLCE